MMQIIFCLSGSVSLEAFFPTVEVAGISAEDVKRILQTVFGWCESHGVWSFESVSIERVSESMDLVTRPVDLQAITMNGLLDELDRVPLMVIGNQL